MQYISQFTQVFIIRWNRIGSWKIVDFKIWILIAFNSLTVIDYWTYSSLFCINLMEYITFKHKFF